MLSARRKLIFAAHYFNRLANYHERYVRDPAQRQQILDDLGKEWPAFEEAWAITQASALKYENARVLLIAWAPCAIRFWLLRLPYSEIMRRLQCCLEISVARGEAGGEAYCRSMLALFDRLLGTSDSAAGRPGSVKSDSGVPNAIAQTATGPELVVAFGESVFDTIRDVDKIARSSGQHDWHAVYRQGIQRAAVHLCKHGETRQSQALLVTAYKVAAHDHDAETCVCLLEQLGRNYLVQKEYERAYHCAVGMRLSAKRIGWKEKVASAELVKADCYQRQQLYVQAVNCAMKGLETAESIDAQRLVADSLSISVASLVQLDDHEHAQRYAEKAIPKLRSLGDWEKECICLLVILNCCWKSQEYAKVAEALSRLRINVKQHQQGLTRDMRAQYESVIAFFDTALSSPKRSSRSGCDGFGASR